VSSETLRIRLLPFGVRFLQPEVLEIQLSVVSSMSVLLLVPFLCYINKLHGLLLDSCNIVLFFTARNTTDKMCCDCPNLAKHGAILVSTSMLAYVTIVDGELAKLCMPVKKLALLRYIKLH
jgi:hypothetical protein